MIPRILLTILLACIVQNSGYAQAWGPTDDGGPSVGNIGCLLVKGADVFAGGFGGVYRTSDGGDHWTHVFSAPGEQILALGVAGENILASAELLGVSVSTDDGDSWIHCDDIVSKAEVTAFATLNGMCFAGGYNCAFHDWYRSTDNGLHWSYSDSICCVTALAPLGNTLLASINDLCFSSPSTLWRSTNLGQSWLPVPSWDDGGKWMTAFATRDSVIYASVYNGGVYRSTDGGDSWAPANGGLIDTVVQSVLVGGGSVFAAVKDGDDPGVYRSTNDGEVWAKINQGLADTNVWSLALRGNILYAGTENEGVWARPFDDLSSVPAQSVPPQSFGIAFSVSPDPATTALVVRSTGGGPRDIALYNALGAEVMRVHASHEGTETLDVGALRSGMYLLTVRDGATSTTRPVMIVR